MPEFKRDLRVLLVDDDTSYIDPVQKYMARFCFAEVQRESDYNTGLKAVENKTYHVTFLDMKMPNPKGDTELGGLFLLREMRKINPSSIYIILTGKGTDSAVSTLYEGADLFKEKSEFKSEGTFDLVDEAAKKAKVKFELDIRPSDSTIDRYLQGLIFNQPALECERQEIKFDEMSLSRQEDIKIQFELLLRRYFHASRGIDLHEFISGFSGSRTALVCADGRYPWMVKYGDKKTLRCEISNYLEYVDGYLRWYAIARQNEPLESTNLGLIVFNLHSDVHPEEIWRAPKIDTFEDFFRDKDSTTIRDFLGILFRNNCKKWYTEEVEHFFIQFATSYRQALKLTTSSLNTTQNYLSAERTKNCNEIKALEGLPNPFIHARHQKPSMFAAFCRTHGDLNARNIILQDEKPFLIDFSHTGYGHAYRDFVKMEASIKYDLLQGDDFKARHELEDALLDNDASFEEDVRFAKRMPAEIEKAYIAISTLRQLAKEISSPAFDKEAYYIALFYTTLKHCEFLAGDSGNRTRLAHALVSAGMICKHLLDKGIFEQLEEDEDLLLSEDPLAPEGRTGRELSDILKAIEKFRLDQGIDHQELQQLSEIAHLYFRDYEGFKDQVKGKSWRVWHLKRGYYTKNALRKFEKGLSAKGFSLSQIGFDVAKASAAICDWIQKKSILAIPNAESICRKGFSGPISVKDICLHDCKYADGCEVKINQKLM